MQSLSSNIRKSVLISVPSSLASEICCFAFYDNHPRDVQNIDVTICTKNKEIVELFKRNIVSSNTLALTNNPTEIKLLRSSNCQRYYLIFADEEVLILKKDLSVHQKLNHIESYDWSDPSCTGQAILRVFRKDDAVPIKFDEDFNIVEELDCKKSCPEDDDGIPVIMQLKQKLSEAKYSVDCNENALKEFVNLRHHSTFSVNKKIHSNLKDEAVAAVLECGKPMMRIFNGSLALLLEVHNPSSQEASSVHIVLHSNNGSFQYSTLYTLSDQKYAPTNNTIAPSDIIYLATVVSIEDLQPSALSHGELNPVLVYFIGDTRQVQPIESVGISAGDLVGGPLHVTREMLMVDPQARLTLMVTSRHTELSVRTAENLEVDLEAQLCDHLHMKNAGGILLCDGAMEGVGLEVTERNVKGVWLITVYTRSENQLLWFVHAVYDRMPLRLLLTVPNWGIVPHTHKEVHDDRVADYSEYASCMVRQMALIREHLDACMVSMHRTNHPCAGVELDLLAAGADAFNKLRGVLREEGEKGIASMARKAHNREERDDAMVVESVEY